MTFAAPPLVVSLGDPCGIGPEVVAAAWSALKMESALTFCVLGDAATLASLGVPIRRVSNVSEASAIFSDALPVLDIPLEQRPVFGKPDIAHAPCIIDWIRHGVALCLKGEARGLITAPIAKSVLYESGFNFPGHTEFLAELCRSVEAPEALLPVMMLTAQNLRVVLATIHTPLAEVPSTLSTDLLERLGRITHDALIRDFGIDAPRLVMAGLNPHAGEDGSIGREEVDILRPAVQAMRDGGIDIRGPFPADSLFHDEARRTYDAVLCMYHDQGLIPLKTLDFWGGVNITLGLPVVRTSPDHGTGFDIAGKGVARPDSFINAMRAADAISRSRMLS